MKNFYSENGLTKSTNIEAINLDWLLTNYVDDISHENYISCMGLLEKIIADGEIETVADAIMYIDDYC